MSGKIPGSGRQKGTPNRDRAALIEKAKSLGVDFFELLCMYANNDWKALGYKAEQYVATSTDKGETYKYHIDPAIRAKCIIEGASFIYPKPKSVEISNEGDNPLDLNLKVDAETMKELVKVARGVGASRSK